MTRSVTKVKIKRETLIEKLKTSREKNLANFEKMQAKYETEHPKCADKVAASLRKFADKLQTNPELMNDSVSYSRYNKDVRVPIENINMPEKPHKQDTENLDRMIRVLESSCEDFIMVSIGDDYSRYL